MRRARGRQVEIDSLAELDRRLARGATTMSGWWVHGVDLSGRSEELARCEVAGASFLACRFADGDAERLEGRGAIVFPALPGVPIDPYRSDLYTAGELYDARPYRASLDARAYAWSRGPQAPRAMLARALHDHAIDAALGGWTAERHLVGVMGGHGLQRDDEGYADAARLGRLLGRRLTVTTGGGPGAMEAATLGARLADRTDDELAEALTELGRVPSYHPSIGAWADAALAVLEHLPGQTETLGIPTWFYGHEPPNVFASAIAKYFSNAQREDVLLSRARGGIIYLPGAAGTVQEVFQAVTPNYYGDAATQIPLILVDVNHWTTTLPVWPLLQSLATDRPMTHSTHLVNTIAEAADLVS